MMNSPTLVDPSHWKGRRVLLTGHTGFKGAWAAAWLTRMGADVTGISLPPEGAPSLWSSLEGKLPLTSHYADIRDREGLTKLVQDAEPEIVLHMAAQALVRRSYREPTETFATNVMGTVNLLEALAPIESLKAVLVVTSDKVYRNQDDGRAFREDDPLGGDDPYSASKAACEIATASLAHSLFGNSHARIATARAGNVIGGGDFSEDRLIPDIWRAAEKGESVTLRYPNATRPWQHVLESVSGYFTYLQALAEDEARALPNALNFGPDANAPVTVGEIAARVQKAFGIEGDWQMINSRQPPEKNFLALDPLLAFETLHWRVRWSADTALQKTVDWYRAFSDHQDAHALTLAQIEEFENSQ